MVKDTEFRIVVKAKLVTPTSVRVARNRVSKILNDATDSVTFDLLRFEPESSMRMSGAPDKRKRRTNEGKRNKNIG